MCSTIFYFLIQKKNQNKDPCLSTKSFKISLQKTTKKKFIKNSYETLLTKLNILV